MSKCSCGCCSAPQGKSWQTEETKALTLNQLAPGDCARITAIRPELRGRRKLADIGLIEGALVRLEGFAPFGGLLRIKFLGTCMSLHRDEASNIIMSREA